MSTLLGGTRALSTNWVVEVFDWESPYPSGGSSKSESAFSVNTALLGGMADAVPDTRQHAYLDRDILRSFTSDGAKAAFDMKSITDSFANKGYKNVGDLQALYGTGANVSCGIIGITCGRSKGNIEGKCQIAVAGPLPPHTRSGNWVIVSSVRAEQSKGPVLMPVFVGQIQQIDSEYSMSEAGAQTARHTVLVNEWSNFLTTPIFFDLRTGATQEQGAVRLSAMISDVAASASSDTKKYLDNCYQKLNPYTGAKMLLLMIGLLNKQSLEGTNGATPQYKLTTSMPAVPDKLLRRMGYPDSVNGANAFAEGFVKIVSGRQSSAFPSLRSGWDGIFTASSGATSESDSVIDIDSYIDSFDDFVDDEDNQPYALNFGAVAQIAHGMSVWDSLSTHCDPSVNEFFTDIYYCRDPASGSILARPVLVVRGKCFKTKAAERACFEDDVSVVPVPKKSASGNAFVGASQAATSALPLPFDVAGAVAASGIKDVMAGDLSGGVENPPYKTWNYFEDLPRIQIDAALITSLRLTNSGVTSPNLFTMGIGNTPSGAIATFLTRFASMYTKRHDAEVAIFGSIPKQIITGFLFMSNGAASSRWFAMLGDLVRVWDGYTYRMAFGSMRIKNPGLALSVGMNIEFSLPNRMVTTTGSSKSVGGCTTYVAHIDSLSTSFQMSGSGQKMTSTDIQFSRMMQVNPNGSELEFCPPSTWGDIWHTTETPPDVHASRSKKNFLPIA